MLFTTFVGTGFKFSLTFGDERVLVGTLLTTDSIHPRSVWRKNLLIGHVDWLFVL